MKHARPFVGSLILAASLAGCQAGPTLATTPAAPATRAAQTARAAETAEAMPAQVQAVSAAPSAAARSEAKPAPRKIQWWIRWVWGGGMEDSRCMCSHM